MRQRYDFGYFLSEGFHSIFTHGFMSFAAVCMIICCLLIMGSFTLVAVNAENMFSDLEAENQFTAYIDESLTQEEAKALQDDIEAVPNVARAEFMTKEQAQEEFEADYEGNELFDGLPSDVYRDRFHVYLDDISKLTETENAIKEVTGVAKTKSALVYGYGVPGILNTAPAGRATVLFTLLAVSLFIIANTIKLATFNRREEIAIMKMCGATNAFVRWPFVFEGLILGLAGILLSCVGLDPILSIRRFTFGQTALLGGISFIPVMIGMFGIGEVFYQIYSFRKAEQEAELEARKVNLSLGRVLPTAKQAKELAVPTLIAAVEGTVIGAIPAAGGDIASIISWGNAKKMSKHPEEYGKGSLEGLAVASSANNAVIGGAMTTMMTLGIPGDAVTAILIGSLTMYGMQPGIKMFTENVTFTATIMILMLLANVVFLIFGLATAKISAKVLNVSQPTVWTAVCILCVVGSFALNNTFFDVGVMFAAGVLGFFLKVFKFPNGPFVLGLLLGSMLESNMRRALVMSHGSWATFVTRPVSCVLFIAIVLTFCWPVLKAAMAKKKAAAQAK